MKRTSAHILYLKTLYNIASDEKNDAAERNASMKDFKQGWLQYIRQNKTTPLAALQDMGITKSPAQVVFATRTAALDTLKAKFESVKNGAAMDIYTRADMAFECVLEAEHFARNFAKEWKDFLSQAEAKSLKDIFNFDRISISLFGDLKAAPQLAYDLNIQAARTAYEHMQKDPKTKVFKANDIIFKHLVQAGFDDVSARSLNQGRYEHDIEVYVRQIDPALDWDGFWQKMSAIAIERGELKAPTSYFGPPPNQNVGDWGDGDVVSPSRKMRHFAATR